MDRSPIGIGMNMPTLTTNLTGHLSIETISLLCAVRLSARCSGHAPIG